MSVDHVRLLGGDCVRNPPYALSRVQEIEPGEARCVDSPDGQTINLICPRRRRNHDDIVSSLVQLSSQILQVKLEAADPRPIPVADQRDFHTSDCNHRSRHPSERGEHALDLLVAMLGRHRYADPAGILRHGRWHDRVAEHAFVE